jgi:hypothetical protein
MRKLITLIFIYIILFSIIVNSENYLIPGKTEFNYIIWMVDNSKKLIVNVNVNFSYIDKGQYNYFIFIKYTDLSQIIPRVYNYTFNGTTYDIFSTIQGIIKGGLFGSAPTIPSINSIMLTQFSIKSQLTPAIKFSDSNGNYIMFSVKSGLPLSGSYKQGNLYYNFSLSSTNTDLSMNNQLIDYKLDLKTIKSEYEVLIYSSSLKISIKNITTYLGNVTEIQFLSQGPLVLIFPPSTLQDLLLNRSTSFPVRLYYNNSIYYIIPNIFTKEVGLSNLTVPFNLALLNPNYLVLFFPEGGNLTLIMNNPKNLIYNYNLTSNNPNYLIYIAVIMIIIIVGLIVYFLRKK